MSEDVFASDLVALHYPEAWRISGFVDTAFVRLQREEFEQGDDRNLEHYRWRAFCRVLAERDGLSDDDITRFVDLALADEDQVMATSALIRLVTWRHLSDKQFERLRMHPAFADPVIQKRTDRERVRRNF